MVNKGCKTKQKTTNGSKYCLDDEWSKESTDDFEQLSHCAQWVSLMARVVKYDGDIPCLELIDTTGQTVRNCLYIVHLCALLF